MRHFIDLLYVCSALRFHVKIQMVVDSGGKKSNKITASAFIERAQIQQHDLKRLGLHKEFTAHFYCRNTICSSSAPVWQLRRWFLPENWANYKRFICWRCPAIFTPVKKKIVVTLIIVLLLFKYIWWCGADAGTKPVYCAIRVKA